MNTRATLNLTRDLVDALGQEARRRGVSASAVAREALASYFAQNGETKREIPWAGLGSSGQTDIAARMEELLAEEWGPDYDRG